MGERRREEEEGEKKKKIGKESNFQKKIQKLQNIFQILAIFYLNILIGDSLADRGLVEAEGTED